MDTLNLKLKNIKCEGCVNTIKEALHSINNIETVIVNKENGSVNINGLSLNKKTIIDMLASLGYPEKNGFFK